MDAALVLFVFFAAGGLGYGIGFNRGWIAGADEMVGHIVVEPDPIPLPDDNVVPMRRAA